MSTRNLHLFPFGTWRLAAHEVLGFDEPVRLAAVRGTLWVTIDGHAEDVLLEPGESRLFSADDGRVLATPLGGEALVGVMPQAVSPGAAPGPLLRRFWRAGRLLGQGIGQWVAVRLHGQRAVPA